MSSTFMGLGLTLRDVEQVGVSGYSSDRADLSHAYSYSWIFVFIRFTLFCPLSQR